jgi:hypothetical protein
MKSTAGVEPIVNEVEPREDNSGLPGFDRIFRAVKGPDQAPSGSDFVPTSRMKPSERKPLYWLSPVRIVRLFIFIWIALTLLTFIIYLTAF